MVARESSLLEELQACERPPLNEIHKVEMFLGELLAARYGVEPEQAVDLPAYLGLVGYSLGSWLILLVACP